MINFQNDIFENIRKRGMPYLVAHRGVNRANVPCNSLLSYKLSIDLKADVVELDVAKSKDGEYFAFHPGMEEVFLEGGKSISEMSAEEVRTCKLLNADGVPTHFNVPTVREALLFLKGKAYINVDKFWTDIKGLSDLIRQCGVEKQVIVKTPPEEQYFSLLEEYASDLMYMTVAWHTDNVTDELLKRNIRFIGIEALFDNLNDAIAQKDYIASMHEKGLLVWVNSIIYNEKEVISAGLTDDLSLERGGDYGWGKLISMGFDFIQTDWLLMLQQYIAKSRMNS